MRLKPESSQAFLKSLVTILEHENRDDEVLKELRLIFELIFEELTEDLKEYRLSIDPKDIHHILFFADIFISDSQTMTAEAAVLGTPSIRYNDFVGRLG